MFAHLKVMGMDLNGSVSQLIIRATSDFHYLHDHYSFCGLNTHGNINLVRFEKNSNHMCCRVVTFGTIHSLLHNNSRSCMLFGEESRVLCIDLRAIMFLSQ